MTRPDVDRWALGIARAVSARGACQKRRVGCVLLDHERRIVATGYNGPARGIPNCVDRPCMGAGTRSGSGMCIAVHAEQNALLQCRDVLAVTTCYVTLEPCAPCVKLLLNTGCRRIIFSEAYESGPGAYQWREGGRLDRDSWVYLPGA
jgi:dCMP deaminase